MKENIFEIIHSKFGNEEFQITSSSYNLYLADEKYWELTFYLEADKPIKRAKEVEINLIEIESDWVIAQITGKAIINNYSGNEPDAELITHLPQTERGHSCPHKCTAFERCLLKLDLNSCKERLDFLQKSCGQECPRSV